MSTTHAFTSPAHPISKRLYYTSPPQAYTKRTRLNGFYPTDSDDLDDIESQSPTHDHSTYGSPPHPLTFTNNHSVRHRLRKPIKSLQSSSSHTTAPLHANHKPRYHKRTFKKFQPQYRYKKRIQSKQDYTVRILLAITLFLIALSIYYFYGDLLTFTSLKNNHHSIIQFIDRYPLSSPIIFIVFECIVVGLTIPGATVLCMAAGLFFNQPMASFYAWFGCGSGAFLCYIFVRFICADCFKSTLNKYGEWFKTFENGLKKNELLYLIYVRYVIIIPFWFVNVAAALFGCSISNFVVSTFIATIPGSLLLTTAGRGLANAFTSYHQEITTFALFKEILWSKDMLFCVCLLLFCLSIPFVLKTYGGDYFDIFSDSSNDLDKKQMRRNDFVDSDSDDIRKRKHL